MKHSHENIGIVTFPLEKASLSPIINYVNIFCSISNNVYLITGNAANRDTFSPKYKGKLNVYINKHSSGKNIFTRIINYAITQLRILFKFIQLSRKANLWVFPIAGSELLPSLLAAKILKKKVVLSLTSSTAKMVAAKNYSLGIVPVWFTKLNCFLSDCIILQSSGLIKEWELDKYESKIMIAHEHILRFNEFRIVKKYSDRDFLIAYIGRLSKEKGVLNYVKALHLILNENEKYDFMVGGDGVLRVKIENYLNENNLNSKVRLSGWIPRGKLPEYLNQLKLIVVPSYTEGLPNIMLEAMACGTPVLATPVGAIPDIIKDGETGFVLENNSPECIAKSVLNIINMSNDKLERVSDNARKLVEEKFTFEKTVERWRGIIHNI